MNSDMLGRLGEGLWSAAGRLTLALTILLGAALLVDKLLERRVAAGVRLWLYAAVLARLALPADWQSPIGVLDLFQRGPEVASVTATVAEGEVHIASTAASASSFGQAVGLAWAVVALGLLARWTWARVRLHRAIATARPLLPTRKGVFVHADVGPVVAGVWRPRIVVPEALTVDPDALAWVLRHERAHADRRDPLLGAVVQLVCILAWPILPVWIAARRIRTLMELACDERALVGTDAAERRRYGHLLLAMAETAPTSRLSPGMAFGSPLMARLRALGWRRRWPVGAQVTLVAGAAALALACAGGAPPEEPEKAGTSSAGPEDGKDGKEGQEGKEGTGHAGRNGATAPKDGRRDPVLTIAGDGELYLGTRRIAAADLEAELRKELQARGSNTVLIRGDKRVMLGSAVDVMSIAKRAGAKNIGALSRGPETMPGQAKVEGSLDKEIIRRIIRRHINEVKYCYESALAQQPTLEGRVEVQFTIGATGQVVASVLESSNMGAPQVENCVVTAVRRWEFPKPLGGGIVVVRYPFNFTPAGGSREMEPPSGVNPTNTPSHTGQLDPSVASKEVRARLGAIKACYERTLKDHPGAAGTVVMRWTITADGTVENAAVERDDLAGTNTSGCIRSLVSRWRFPAPTGGSVQVSYPFVFQAGPSPTAVMP